MQDSSVKKQKHRRRPGRRWEPIQSERPVGQNAYLLVLLNLNLLAICITAAALRQPAVAVAVGAAYAGTLPELARRLRS